MEKELAVKQQPMELAVSDLEAQVHKIQAVMKNVMQEGQHYGTIPGTNKPTLLKPGAEKLNLTFRLAPTHEVTKNDLPNGHREVTVICTLTHIPTGQVFGQGVGSCSTMEGKYRYRKRGDERIENPDLADQYNTVLKMAKKRALVDATLTATAASDIFTQDIEEAQVNRPQPTKELTNPFKGFVHHIERKSGMGKNNKPYNKFTITIDGYDFGTFDKQYGEAADFAKLHQKPVMIRWVQNGQWRNIEAINAITDEDTQESPLPEEDWGRPEPGYNG